jgi:hypothetical protein
VPAFCDTLKSLTISLYLGRTYQVVMSVVEDVWEWTFIAITVRVLVFCVTLALLVRMEGLTCALMPKELFSVA